MKMVSVALLMLVMALICASASAATDEEIEQAIENGTAWLVTQQNPDGSFGASYYAVGRTGFAVLKLEDRAVELGYETPFDPDYEYSENVQKGLDFIFSRAVLMDYNGDGTNEVYFGGHIVYETSVAMMAIAASTTPDRVVGVAGSPVNGMSYKQVEGLAMNYLILSQNNDGGW